MTITKFWLYATLALLALSSAVVSLKSDLIYDDQRAARAMRYIGSFSNVANIARQAHPLRQISIGFETSIWETDSMGFHATNLVLHALAAMTLLALLRRLLENHPVAMWTAGLFAVMPIGAAAVGVVAHRNEMLGLLLMLLTCLAWMRPQRGWGAWVAGGVYALLATAETSMSLLLPLLLIVYDALLMAPVPADRQRARRVETGGAALALVAVQLAYATWFNRFGIWQFESWEVVPAWSEWPIRLLRDWPAGVWTAVRWLAIPLPFDYDHGLTPVSLLATLTGVVVIVALGTVVWSQARTRPRLAFGAAWLLAGCAVAALNVFRHHYGAIYESELYAAGPGLCLLGGIGIDHFCKQERGTRRFWFEVAGLALVAVALGAWGNWRAARFGSQEQMLSTTLANHPDSGLAHLEMGRHCINLINQPPNNKVARVLAEKEIQRACDLHWEYYETYGNLGEMAMSRHDYTRAESCYRRALELNPEGPGARLRLGNALHGQQRFAAAREVYQQLLADRPRHIALYRLIADTYEAEGRFSDARRFSEQAQRLSEEVRQQELEIQRKLGKSTGDAPPVVTLPARK